MLPRRRCRCNRQRVPRRRARVGGLCGFPDTAERVPTGNPKAGRCAGVRECFKDLLEACPEDSFHFMTPVGYVDLTAQDAEQLRQGAAMLAHAGESGWEIPIPADKLLQQELVTARKAENGQWYAITTDPQPEMAESEQVQEMHL